MSLREKSSNNYLIQLDSLRAFAVIGVTLQHWIGGVFNFCGGAGVMLFFVLSGYLITRILFVEKYSFKLHNRGFATIVKTFLLRRTLRIFPIYFIFLIAFVLIGDPYLRANWYWYFSYCSNILRFIHNGSTTTMYGHTWSLAVEEQFYLIWPWVILLVHRKWESKVLLVFVLFACVFRFCLFEFGLDTEALAPSNFDAFGIGGLLAYFELNASRLNGLSKLFMFFKKQYSLIIVGCLLVSLCFYFVAFASQLNWIKHTFYQLIYVLFAVALIYKAGIGFKGALKPLFENPFLLFVGKISYGIYLYHKVMPWLFEFIGHKTGLYIMGTNSWINYWIMLGTTLIVSSLSWFMIEQPLNRLKNRFNYT